MVQTLTANRAHDPLDVRTLQRHPWRSQHFLHPKFLHLLREARTEDAVTVSQQEMRRAVPGKCLPQLLRGPFRSRMSRHAENGESGERLCARPRNTYSNWKRMVGTVKKSTDTIVLK